MSGKRFTVFGDAQGEDAKFVQECLSVLYGNATFSAKELKKIEKLKKLEAKKKKLKEQSAKADKKPKVEKKQKTEKKSDDPPYVPPPEGQKKDTKGPMPSKYNPKHVEDSWYSWWSKEGFNKPEYEEEKKKGSFTMVIPPPNVTGTLHLGHALTSAIEDTVTRWHRMKGERVLWNPGCDHAGIATQIVVEKKLAREEGITRQDLGREKFLKRVWEWKEKNGATIYKQLQGMGTSCDWDRAAFTMDPKLCEAVQEAFIRMHESGLIYRAERLINWSCRLNSAIADIEVEKIDVPGRTLLSVPGYDEKVEFGVLTSFAYELQDGSGEIVVATTRPETMLGDVAVAVHPQDPRYSSFIGKKLKHPFLPKRDMIIVADDYVTKDFGTGAVKITPGHDQNDYELGERHNLPVLTILDRDGNMAGDCGEFKGMKRFDCRKIVIQKLKDLNLYRGDTDNPMVVPICSRSKDIVEPLSVPQWFCKCDTMAADAVNAVRNGDLKLIPKVHENIWYNWLENIRDWCISRQLWWGHRIPAYFVDIDDANVPKGSSNDNKYWVSARNEEEAKQKAAKKFAVDVSKISVTQDEDVLDTWFSSGLFPMSIFGWPNQTEDMEKFFPGNLLETGHDILFFWVARMVMMCKHLTGKLPFTEVYLHSMVRDAHGRKMSKSLGNVVDPMDVRNGISLEDLQKKLLAGNLDPKEVKRAQEGQAQDFPEGIPECGVDALRFALCALSSQGRDINLDVKRIFGYRKMCNKLWQATRLVRSHLGDNFKPEEKIDAASMSVADKYILSRLSYAANLVNTSLEAYDFVHATTLIQGFWVTDFCDTYLELTKSVFAADSTSDSATKTTTQNVLFACVDNGLRLIAPFMPFLAEELYQRLLNGEPQFPTIHVAPYPTTLPWGAYDEDLETKFSAALQICNAGRSLKVNYLKVSDHPKVFVRGLGIYDGQLDQFAEILKTLIKASEVNIMTGSEQPPAGCVVKTTPEAEIHILVKGLVDFEKEIQKLEKKLAVTTRSLTSTEAFLAKGVDKMPQEVFEEKQQKKVTLVATIESITQLIESYKQLA